MLKLRLARTGRKKRPYYRVVVAEHTAPRDGRFVEIVGQYDPVSEPPVVNVKSDRISYWLEHGARPTETVHRLLAKEGLIGELQPKPRSKRAEAKRQAAEAAARAEADAAAAPAAPATASETPADDSSGDGEE